MNNIRLTGRVPMAAGMARFGTGYAGYFNVRHERVGHFFQNRYRSVPVEDENYFLALVRYIHLNPVRAGIVPDLEALAEYPWTGHAALMGNAPLRFQDVATVLDRFGAQREEARRRLASWMGQSEPPSLEAAERAEPTVLELAVWVAAALGESERALRSGVRRGGVSRARAPLAHLACNVLDGAGALLQGLAEAGYYLGVVSNKRGDVLRKEAERLGWNRWFKRLIGSKDATRDKPSPDPVHLALGAGNLTVGRTVWFVGDTDIDLECAVNAGCVPVLLRPEAPGEK